jgi:hypothetical protein
MYNAVGQWLLQNDSAKNRVDAFTLEPLAGCRNALLEYLSMHAGRMKILESAPRLHLSDPANETFSFSGLDGQGIALRFSAQGIQNFNRLYTNFRRPQLDSFTVAEMRTLRTLLVLNIKYLRGCDLLWVPEPDGKFSSLAMLQDKTLTVRVRAGTGGRSKHSEDEKSSSVEVVSLEPQPNPCFAQPAGKASGALPGPASSLPSENGYIGFW